MRPRLLLVITAYNGADIVPRALVSATRVDQADCDVDVLVLDDCSPEPGFSDYLRELCADLGAHYYRSPRNLGIPRNVNLGLLRALAGGYTHVLISNSDVIYPSNLASGLVAAATADPRIGSVMAWSNNVSVYSLPCASPDEYLPDQDTVDWISAQLATEFGTETLDTPSGISFCMLIPVSTLPKVGLMDPVFGRGYCEEVDWSLRSQERGLRTTVAPSVFVYHMGGGTNVGAGLVAAGHATIPAHEKIVDLRHPRFRADVAAFLKRDPVGALEERALSRLVREAAMRWGWVLLPRPRAPLAGTDTVICAPINSSGTRLSIAWRGFRTEVDVNAGGAAQGLETLLGLPAGAQPPRARGTEPAMRQPLFDTIYPENV